MVSLTLLVALVLASACSSSGGRRRATSTTAPQTTTTDPYAVPPTIDVPYVQRVMDALDVLTGRAARALVINKTTEGEWMAVSRAILDDDGLRDAKAGAQLELSLGLRDYRASPGQPHTIVRQVLIGHTDCMTAAAFRDSREIVTLAGAAADKKIALKTARAEWDPERINPTGWVIANVSDPAAEIKPCGG